jgi:Holliday junction resolvase RusA-like endonuclease
MDRLFLCRRRIVSGFRLEKSSAKSCKEEMEESREALPTTNSVAIEIINFYEGRAPDADNIAKPIQDALNGLIYADDAQVIDVSSRKRNINGAFE